MGGIQGFSNSQKKRSYGATSDFLTLQKMHDDRVGADVIQRAVFEVETLAGTAISENKVTIVGTSAVKGDTIQHVLSGSEFVISSVDGDVISCLSEIPTSYEGDDFELRRYVTFKVSKDGSIIVSVAPAPIQFIRDGADQIVTEDTVDPNNTVGLPVQIVGADGTTINLTAGDINVQTSHTGANPDSMRIGDGTTELEITANNEAKTHDADLLELLGTTYLGQLARAASLGVTLSAEDIALLTNIYDKYSAGQTARADSLGVTLSTEDIALLTNLYNKYSAGQSARAASLGVTLSTEDQATFDAINAKLEAGQKASAISTSVVLSTEQEVILSAIKTAVESKSNLAHIDAVRSQAVAQAGTTLIAGIPTEVYKMVIQNQMGPMQITLGGTHVAYALGGAEITIECGGLTGNLVAYGLDDDLTGNLTIDLLG